MCPPERPFHIEYETPPPISAQGPLCTSPLEMMIDTAAQHRARSGLISSSISCPGSHWIPLREPGVDEVPKILQMPRPSRPCGPVGTTWDAGTLDASLDWPFDLDSSTP